MISTISRNRLTDERKKGVLIMIKSQLIKVEERPVAMIIDVKEYERLKEIEATVKDLGIAASIDLENVKTYSQEEVDQILAEEDKEEVISTLKSKATKQYGTIKNFIEAFEWKHSQTSLRNAFSINHSRFPALKEIAFNLGYDLQENISYSLQKITE